LQNLDGAKLQIEVFDFNRVFHAFFTL
jgi:hypothetical protein